MMRVHICSRMDVYHLSHSYNRKISKGVLEKCLQKENAIQTTYSGQSLLEDISLVSKMSNYRLLQTDECSFNISLMQTHTVDISHCRPCTELLWF